MLEEDPTVFVGKIYVQHSQGYTFLIYTTSDVGKGGYTCERIVNENVALALGNDSIIYVKSTAANVTRFYSIKHAKGEKVLGVKDTDSINFSLSTKGKKFEYVYRDSAE